jgi:hypothetical protein
MSQIQGHFLGFHFFPRCWYIILFHFGCYTSKFRTLLASFFTIAGVFYHGKKNDAEAIWIVVVE